MDDFHLLLGWLSHYDKNKIYDNHTNIVTMWKNGDPMDVGSITGEWGRERWKKLEQLLGEKGIHVLY